MYFKRERNSSHDEFLRRMGEPDDLKELRRQAERIERERQQSLRDMMHNAEAQRLRQQIREAGEMPCR